MSGKEVEKVERIEEEKPLFGIHEQDKCQEHDEEWEFYCEDHRILCCRSCVSSSHCRCKNVDNIYTDIIKNDANISNLGNTIENLETAAKHFIEDLKEAKLAASSKANLSSALRYIDDMQNFVCTKFDNLKTSLIEQFKLEESKLLDKIDKKILLTTNIVDELHQKKQFLLSTKKYGTPENVLTATYLIDKGILPMQSSLKTERDSLYTLDCTVVCSSDFSYIFKNDESFATLQIDKLPYEPNQSTDEKAVKLKFVASAELSEENDADQPWIEDMDYFVNGRLAVIDSKNSKFYIMDENLEIKQVYRLNGEPTGVSVFSEEEVVVAMEKDSTVEFLKVSKTNDITSVRTLKTASHCDSICPMNDSTFLVLSYYDKHPLKMLTLEGKEAKFNNLPKQEYGRYACNCTYIRDRDMVVLTDKHNDVVYFHEFGKDGVNSREVKDDKIKAPEGVCVGPNGCLLICSHGTNKIVQLSSSGKVVATHEVSLYPNTVCMSKDGRRLTVASLTQLQSFHFF